MSARRALTLFLVAAAVALPGSAYAAFYYPPPPPIVAPQLPPNSKPATRAPDHGQMSLVAPTYVPPGVGPSGVYTTPLTKGSKTPTATYNLDWTIGTAGKSGCMVCHGDKNLVRVIGGKTVSLYVDTLILQDSAHAKLLCTDCHVDFAYKTPHPTTMNGKGDEWRMIAKSSCGQSGCHPQEFLEWGKSSHSTAGTAATGTVGAAGSSAPGKPRPLCGDCHTGHTIPRKDDVEGNARVQASAVEMCGACHVKSTESYNDYYHGAAYKNGATDAPACWQCHNTHLVLPTKDKLSWTNPDNLVQTCGQCHKGVGDGYVAYAPFIHTHDAQVRSNPIVSVVDTASTSIQNFFRNVFSAFH